MIFHHIATLQTINLKYGTNDMSQESLPKGVCSAYQYPSSMTEKAIALEAIVKTLSRQLKARLDVEYSLPEDNDEVLYGVSVDLLNEAEECIFPLSVTMTIDEAIARMEMLNDIIVTLKIRDIFNLKNNFTNINNKLTRYAEESDIFEAEVISNFIMFFNMSMDYMASYRGVTVNGLLK